MKISKQSVYFDYVSEVTQHKFRLPICVFKKPENENEYQVLQKYLDTIIDEVRDNANHPLAIAAHIIGDNLEEYDDAHHPPIGSNVTDIDLVRYLMTQNNLTQKEMADIFGSQGNVSKFLNGERKLSKLQIEKLVARFKISADVFIKSE